MALAALDGYELANYLTLTKGEGIPEMKGLLGKVKRFWNEIQAVVDPQMIAVTDNGIIIYWIDERTGETPWFS